MQKIAIADVATYTTQVIEATLQIIESDQLKGEEVVELKASKEHNRIWIITETGRLLNTIS